MYPAELKRQDCIGHFIQVNPGTQTDSKEKIICIWTSTMQRALRILEGFIVALLKLPVAPMYRDGARPCLSITSRHWDYRDGCFWEHDFFQSQGSLQKRLIPIAGI